MSVIGHKGRLRSPVDVGKAINDFVVGCKGAATGNVHQVQEAGGSEVVCQSGFAASNKIDRVRCRSSRNIHVYTGEIWRSQSLQVTSTRLGGLCSSVQCTRFLADLVCAAFCWQ